jgi:adenylosuccinate lyase
MDDSKVENSAEVVESVKYVNPIYSGDTRYTRETEEIRKHSGDSVYYKNRFTAMMTYFDFIIKTTHPEIFKDDVVVVSILVDAAKHITNWEESYKIIKKIEKDTNHDIKAIELFVKKIVSNHPTLSKYTEYVHFGLTSQDINNVALSGMMLNMRDIISKKSLDVLKKITLIISDDKYKLPMLSHTHGQPAVPTTMGKELMVTYYRMQKLLLKLSGHRLSTKFGGAVNNLNAHYQAYSDCEWDKLMEQFLKGFNMDRDKYATQVGNGDSQAELFHICSRLCTVLFGFAQDMWLYIHKEYFKMKIVKSETGSSTMPQKVNPIQFENAKMRFKMARKNFNFYADELPVSFLQRDLCDSTLMRDIGVPFADMSIALSSILKGLNRIDLNVEKIRSDLEGNVAVLTEGIQTILRKHFVKDAYNITKDFCRVDKKITSEDLKEFIESLDVKEYVKKELRTVTLDTYLGNSANYMVDLKQ